MAAVFFVLEDKKYTVSDEIFNSRHSGQLISGRTRTLAVNKVIASTSIKGTILSPGRSLEIEGEV